MRVLSTVVGLAVGIFTLWNDAYPAGIRDDVIVAAALGGAFAIGVGVSLWLRVPAWTLALLTVLVPLAFVVQFGATVSYWEEAAVRCEPPDPVLTDCPLVTTASEAGLAGFAGLVGGLALGSLLRARASARDIE